MTVNNTSIYKDSLTYPERSKLNGLKKNSMITDLSGCIKLKTGLVTILVAFKATCPKMYYLEHLF